MSKKVLVIVMAVLLVIFAGLYIKEKNSFKSTLTPLTKGDYFQRRLVLTDYFDNYNQDKYLDKKNNNTLKTEISVPFISQLPDYPNGCEAASAVMLLNAYGIDITLTEFIESYMEKDVIYSNQGAWYGPNPETTYAGNPADGVWGFGIFAPGIKSAMEKVIANTQNIYESEDIKYYVYCNSETAYSLDYYKNSFPLVIWVSTDYEPISEMWTWKSYDNEITYTYPKNSHTIVVIDSDDEYYYVNDPLMSSGGTKIEKEKLEKSFDSNGRQIVGIKICNFVTYDRNGYVE